MFSHLPAARAVTTPLGNLHVVSVVFNPLRFASRYYLLHDFRKHVQCSGATFHVAEAAQGIFTGGAGGPVAASVSSRRFISGGAGGTNAPMTDGVGLMIGPPIEAALICQRTVTGSGSASAASW